MMNRRFLVALSVLLTLIALCTSVGMASSSSGVTQWNSVTEDASDSFSVDIHIDEPREVEFRVSSGSPYEWIWTVNDEEIEEESEGESSNFAFWFDEYGSYTVCALGEEGNETAASACWNVTVCLVIEDENDVRDLEGLEDYTLRFCKRPERIISMAPSCTEILFAVGAGDRVVGVTDYCDYPPEALELETIGGYSTPSLEKIVAFEPDLIVGAHGNPNDVVYRLIELEKEEKLDYQVYGQNPEDIDEILTQIKIMGAITGGADDADSLVQDLSDRLEPIKEETESLTEAQRPRVFYNIGDFFTAGDGTFINEVIELAGGTNIAGDKSGYFIMNLEELIDKNPHVIICDSGMGTMDAAKEGIMEDPQLQRVYAVNNSWVYVIDGDIIDRPGPRIVDAVEIVYGDYSDFFAAAEADEEDNGGDPGSSGGSSAKVTPPPTATPAPATPTVTKASRHIPFLQAGEEVAMIFEDMDVALIALEAADGNVSDLNVAVERVEKSAEIPDPPGIAYAYLDIEIDHEETADLDGWIECKVLKSWIADNAIDETSIRLYRYNNDGGGWQALATSKSREENDFVYFEAETSQFSLFVITGEKAAVTPPVTPVSAPFVILDQIAAVGVGEPLTVRGTSNRKDGFAIVVTVKGPVELPPQTVAIANGAFEATFDTSTVAAAGGIYTINADDGEGHMDEATVTIGAASATSPLESTAPTSEVPGFEAILAVVAVLMVRRLRRSNGRF